MARNVAKHWCFTYNNPVEDPFVFQKLVEDTWATTYCVFQPEKGDSGTPHYQGTLPPNEGVSGAEP